MENKENGKTYSATRFCRDEIQKHNYILITNIKSLSKNIKGSIYNNNLLDIIELVTNQEGENKYIIFFDEIFTALEKNGSLRSDVLSFLSQLRKRQILLVTTAQEWLEINITLRRYCRFVVDCDMKTIPFTKKAICINIIKDGDLLHWDQIENDYVAPVIQTNIFKGNEEIINIYDTFETIDTSKVLLNKSRQH